MSSYSLEIRKWYQENKEYLKKELELIDNQREKEEYERLYNQVETLLETDLNYYSEQYIYQLLSKVYNLYERNQSELHEKHRQSYVSIGNHRLPPLPYNYDALEPYIAK